MVTIADYLLSLDRREEKMIKSGDVSRHVSIIKPDINLHLTLTDKRVSFCSLLLNLEIVVNPMRWSMFS